MRQINFRLLEGYELFEEEGGLKSSWGGTACPGLVGLEFIG